METFLSYFKRQYKNKLNKGIKIYGQEVRRYNGFRNIFQQLLKKKQKNFVIIETGALRNPDENYWAEGRSSFLFYEFLARFGGELISIDNNAGNLKICRKALSKIRSSKAKLTLVRDNSVHALWRINRAADLVYLDSLDLDRENPEPSMSHHLKELASLGKIIDRSRNLLIAVDDNFKTFGKGRYILEWAKDTKQKILFNGYQILIKIVN